MARIDKYDPVSGGFRAPLNAAYTASDTPVAVGLNSTGKVVAGAGTTGIVGVLLVPTGGGGGIAGYVDKAAGDIVDVMTAGEIVEFSGAAGTLYTANTTTGVISSAAASGTQIPVGYTVEASRLIVRAQRD